MRWFNPFFAMCLMFGCHSSKAETEQGQYPPQQPPPSQQQAQGPDQNVPQQPPRSQWLPPQQPSPYQQPSEDTSIQSQPRLGIVVMGLTRDLRQYFGAPQDRGVLVAHVETNSIAARAGLQVGDVIIRVADRRIRSTDDVISALAAQPGGRIQLHVVRNGMPLRIDAMFPQRSPEEPENNPTL